MDKHRPPAPGSQGALDLGCTCPVMDNGYGRGWHGGAKNPETGETLFVMQMDCPLHGIHTTKGGGNE